MYASAGHAGTARSQAVQNQAPWNGTPGIIAAGAGEPCLCVQTWFPTKKESEDDCNEEKIKNREPGRPGADADDDEYLPDGINYGAVCDGGYGKREGCGGGVEF